MLNFDFLEKGLGIVSSPHFVYDFSRKMFRMFHSINRPNFIVWLALLFEIIASMCIVIFVTQVVMSKIFKLILSF